MQTRGNFGTQNHGSSFQRIAGLPKRGRICQTDALLDSRIGRFFMAIHYVKKRYSEVQSCEDP
jgi:hypothetical protein